MNVRETLGGAAKPMRRFASMTVLLCLSGVLASCASYIDPSDTIRDKFERASDLDVGDGWAYTSNSPPSVVADDISDAAEPLDERRHGDDHYLQYSDDIVAIFPYRGGSKILLDDYEDGYRRHSAIVRTWGWSASPPSSFRGGGPGSGK
ncbi:hypothetical protein GCM10027447_11620 [Glycomyces halotolerans]